MRVSGWGEFVRRHPWLDHHVRAAIRFDRLGGGRLSAGMTYYAFFAIFALGLLAFVILGHLWDTPGALAQVAEYLSDTFPRLDVTALRDARDAAGWIALFGLPLTGLFWIDSMRSSSRTMWGLDEHPGTFAVRWAIDMAVLVTLGVLLATSLAISFGAQSALSWLTGHTVGPDAPASRLALQAAAVCLGFLVNLLLSTALLTLAPRLRLSFRRVIGPALIITVGLEALKTLGQFYFNISSSNPAYTVVAGAVGMLLFLKLLNMLILYAAAHAATSSHGTVVDLANRRRLRPAASSSGHAAQPQPDSSESLVKPTP